MKTTAQLRESIERFQRVFWEKLSEGRPPIGVVDTDIYLPVKYIRRPVIQPITVLFCSPDFRSSFRALDSR